MITGECDGRAADRRASYDIDKTRAALVGRLVCRFCEGKIDMLHAVYWEAELDRTELSPNCNRHIPSLRLFSAKVNLEDSFL